jgi:hypothetical protein
MAELGAGGLPILSPVNREYSGIGCSNTTAKATFVALLNRAIVWDFDGRERHILRIFRGS